MIYIILFFVIFGASVLIANHNASEGIIWIVAVVLAIAFPPLGATILGLHLWYTWGRHGGGKEAAVHDQKVSQKNYEKHQAKKGLPADPHKYFPKQHVSRSELPWSMHPNTFEPDTFYKLNTWKEEAFKE